MRIFNNINIIYSDIRNIYQNQYHQCIKILNGFFIILSIRFIIIGLNNLFANSQTSLQYIIFYLATSLLMIGLDGTDFYTFILFHMKKAVSFIFDLIVAEANRTCNATTSNNSDKYSNSLSDA